jgi:chromosome partitioning protein
MPKLIEKAGYELVVIDCPPGGGAVGGDLKLRSDDVTKSALMACHILLLPIRPTPLDYHASVTMLPMLKDVSFYRPDLRVFLAINGKPPTQTRLGREARQVAIDVFSVEGLEIRVLEAEICSRQIIAEAPATGKVVVDLDSTSKASQEIQQLTEEILQCLTQSAAV